MPRRRMARMRDRGGCRDIGRLEIVAPGAANAVSLDTKSLWIAPDLWKTLRTRFPQGLWTRRERAPTRSTGHPYLG
jgi:hypothetical protein